MSAVGFAAGHSYAAWGDARYMMAASAARSSASAAAPVEPVDPVKKVTPDVVTEFADRFVREKQPAADTEGFDLAALAARVRANARSSGEAASPAPAAQSSARVFGPDDMAEARAQARENKESEAPKEFEALAETLEGMKCEACHSRKYQDGSNDLGVSFKSASRISPAAVPAAVRGHEQEHVAREQAKAKREDRKVVSQNVTLHSSICPDCGKTFISGGTTRTVTAADDRQSGQKSPYYSLLRPQATPQFEAVV